MRETIENALELRHVSRSFGNFALQDVSFVLPQGCILGLIGENGAGKSTTIRLIMDTLRRDAGEILVLGQDNTAPAFQNLKEEIGVVLDEAYFPEILTVNQVNVVMKNTYRQWDENLFYEYIGRFDLPKNLSFKDFSRGMKMKLAIATALSHHPKLLILDEATSGLDPIVRDEVLEIFSEFTRDERRAILISSHILSDLEKLCDYIAFLHQGRLKFCEEKDRLLERYGVVHCTREQFSQLPREAVLGMDSSAYGVRALILRGGVSSAFRVERATVEDIILLLTKGGNNQ